MGVLSASISRAGAEAMQAFPHAFLLLLFQIALGGLFAIAVTPFYELERGFYKSTASVLFVLALLTLSGKLYLYGFVGALSTALEISLQAVFSLLLALYIFSLWGERFALRARAFALSLFAGVSVLISSALNSYEAPFFSVETLVYPLSFLLSSLLLGGVTVGMLIGHWYLIDTGQRLDPFVRVFKFFVAALICETAFLLLSPVLVYWLGTPETLSRLERLWREHYVLLAARLLIAQVGPLILSLMISRTLKIPHTMAATGLFYIALLGVFVGELLGKQIFTLTSLPF